jgi:hypothetical protein
VMEWLAYIGRGLSSDEGLLYWRSMQRHMGNNMYSKMGGLAV